ncbi:MAG TPA: adenylate/guanylate cyclase domain-containing protein, partial [Anaerolineaceae bacterium]|nr:adenylate/guanylate cyclase domain-containing protein [Anaerolineaceae bacterium]
MSKSIPEQIQDLRNAIAAQEMLRPTLGDAIVDATIVVLNQKLTALESELGKSEEQRKLVTILFSDIKGSTAMAEKMDPEEWSDIMKQAFQFLIDPIYRHQGLVARLMGDAILAFFGAETVREDDAERAVRAGLEILTGMKPFQEAIAQQHGAEFGVRVGINTGLALLSNVGTDQAGEFTALGDAVNLAARMEQSAPPNHLLIAPDTYALVRERFEIEAQAPIMVKGKSEPIPVYVVVRELPKSTVEVRRGMAGLDVPMVGREAEMERLRAGYQQARGGKANCILVTGEAGSGKSRLRYEFRRWVESQGEAVQMMQGRADAATWHAPYSLLHDLFGNACSIQESDPAA